MSLLKYLTFLDIATIVMPLSSIFFLSKITSVIISPLLRFIVALNSTCNYYTSSFKKCQYFFTKKVELFYTACYHKGTGGEKMLQLYSNIKTRRLELEMTQSELAEKNGICR